MQGTGFILASLYPEGILVVGMIKLNKEKLSVRCVAFLYVTVKIKCSSSYAQFHKLLL